MRHVIGEMTGFNGGGFKSQFTLNCDVGPTYKEIVLRTNLNVSQITQILIKLNGDPIYDISAEELVMLEKYKDSHVEAGVIVIPFSDFSVKTIDGQNLTELVTLSGDNLDLIIKTGEATTTQVEGNVTPTLKATAIMGAAKPERVVIPRMYSSLVQVGSTGKNVYKNFNRSPNIRIRRMHMKGPVSQLEIVRSRLSRFDAEKIDNDFLLKRNKLIPQSGYFHFDPIMTKFAIADFMETAGSNFEINPYVDATGDIPVLFETVEKV